MKTKPCPPPYRFPDKRPSIRAIDSDGEVLVLNGTGEYFYHRLASDLKEGDVWVPASYEGCMMYLDGHWQPGDRRHAAEDIFGAAAMKLAQRAK